MPLAKRLSGRQGRSAYRSVVMTSDLDARVQRVKKRRRTRAPEKTPFISANVHYHSRWFHVPGRACRNLPVRPAARARAACTPAPGSLGRRPSGVDPAAPSCIPHWNHADFSSAQGRSLGILERPSFAPEPTRAPACAASKIGRREPTGRPGAIPAKNRRIKRHEA